MSIYTSLYVHTDFAGVDQRIQQFYNYHNVSNVVMCDIRDMNIYRDVNGHDMIYENFLYR